MKKFFTKRACVLSIAVVLIMALTGMAVFAATGSKTLEANYDNIKIYVDGAVITPTDVNGNSTEPFSVDGTVYLPLRAISEALGKTVEWDEETNSVYIGAAPSERLTIIHMNDVHGRTQAEPYISQMAKDLKAKGENVLILDAGDRLHGQIPANLTEGETMAEIMNMVGYDAMVAGNHDFNFGVERLLELSGMMDFPLLAANVKDNDGNYLFEQYKIFDMNNIKVGVFGLATPETTSKNDPRIAAALIFEDPVSIAGIMVDTLKAKNCDIIIALAHLGDDELSAENERSDALAAIPGIDVIIDAHSHTLLEKGRVINGALIAQTGGHSENIGIIEITVNNGVVINKTARLVTVPAWDNEIELPQDDAVLSKIAEEEKKIEPITSVVVGSAPVRLEGEREAVRTRETNLGNLIADSMLYVTGADISFLTGGNIRASIEAGDITMGDVLTTLPFSNLIVTLELKGSDILEMLEHGVSGYPETVGSNIQVGGLSFEFDPSAEPMSRVTKAELAGGGIILPDEVYTVATIEFLAEGGDGYAMMQNGGNIIYYQGDAEALAEYLGTNPVISAEPEGRITPIEAGKSVLCIETPAMIKNAA